MYCKTIVLLLLTCVSFASTLLPVISSEGSENILPGYPAPGRTVLFDQAYSGIMDNAGQGDGLYLRADDFILPEVGRVESIEWWSIFVSSQSNSFHLRIFADNSGVPGSLLWEVPVMNAVNTDTGDDFTGYNIYRSEVILDPADYFQTEEGITYWFSMYYNGTGFYWGLLTEGGNMAMSYDGGDWSSLEWIGMFRLNGTYNQSLQGTTWGDIKTIFQSAFI